jgi:transposase
MSAKERDRLVVLERVRRRELTVVAAALELGLSVRQTRRLWKRFSSGGAGGQLHRARGRASNNATPAELADRVIKRHQERYSDFGPTLACEKLAEEKLVIGPDTLVRLLKERGLWQPMRRRKRHRRRRERRASFGSLVQMDGSHHDWFEGRGEPCVLMVMIDDASNQSLARFYPSEDLAAAFDLFGRWCKTHGIPRGLYVDRHSLYRDEDHPEKPTQFGRAMKQLRVKLICARSPQAKGRVERRNRTLQDRLVKELRLRRIKSMSQANAFLEQRYLQELNARLAIEPRGRADLHRLPEADEVLEEILCRVEDRVVGQDWCVRYQNRWLQIEAGHAPLSLPRRTVQVKERSDGTLVLSYQNRRLNWQGLNERPVIKRLITNNRRWKPSADHPWTRPALTSTG